MKLSVVLKKGKNIMERAIRNELFQAKWSHFDLDPFFMQDKLPLEEMKRFNHIDEENSRKIHCFFKFHNYPNPYIENEVRAFIQYLVVDLKYMVSTLVSYNYIFELAFSNFISHFDPDCCSILEYEYEDIIEHYADFMRAEGRHVWKSKMHYVIKSDMEWGDYESNAYHIYYFRKFYRFVQYERLEKDVPEYERDTWDIRKLGINFKPSVHRNRWTISFEKIEQPWFKIAIKKYIYYRLPIRSIAAVIDDLKGTNLFSTFLKEFHPEVCSFKDFNRELMLDYIKFVRGKGFVPSTSNRRISVMKTFLEIGNMLSYEDFPVKPLIYNSDYDDVVHRLPKFFSDRELREMNRYIATLPRQIGRMFFVLENCGMRVSDLCATPISVFGRNCLIENEKGDYSFTYYMPKTYKYNTIPVSELVARILLDAIAESREKYGKECVYVFAKSVTSPISTETFTMHMNRMTKIYGVKNDEGKPLRVRGHTFRGTVATKYANCGINLDVIRAMLGQEKIGVLKHYITIHSATMIDYMRPITEEDNNRILQIGESPANQISEPRLDILPLPNGGCMKNIESGICAHANSCYGCRMFHATADYLPIYEAQLLEAENNIEIAKLNGYIRLQEVNENIKEQLEKIIDGVKTNG